VTWSFSDLEKHTYKRGLELTVGRLKRMEPNIRGLEPNLDVSWRDRVLGTWHHMGTTRMHNDPRMGVVDSNNRVHSVENLYVAGSSVFTTGGSHAPTLTLLALTLRLADHLKITQGLT
jgi:choline dehydrogenase-like flavoprotein